MNESSIETFCESCGKTLKSMVTYVVKDGVTHAYCSVRCAYEVDLKSRIADLESRVAKLEKELTNG